MSEATFDDYDDVQFSSDHVGEYPHDHADADASNGDAHMDDSHASHAGDGSSGRFQDDADVSQDNKNVLYISLLPKGVTKAAIEEEFNKFGAVVSVALSPQDRSSVFAFVTFSNTDGVQRALEEHNGQGIQIGGHHINVERAKPSRNHRDDDHKIYVGGIPTSTPPGQLKQLLQDHINEQYREKHGDGSECPLIIADPLPKLGFAFIPCSSVEQGDELIALLHDSTFQGNQLSCQHSRRNMNAVEQQPEHRRLFVRHLPLGTTEQEVRDLVSEFGSIDDINVIDDGNETKAFFCFPDDSCGERCLATLNNSTFKGVEIQVEYQRPRRRDKGGDRRFSDRRRYDDRGDRGDRGGRPPRRFEDRYDDRPPRRFGGDDRPPRRFDDDRPPRRFGGDDRPPRRFDDDRPPRRFGGEERPPRRFGDDDRPPRRFGDDDRPPRRFDDDRPPRRFDDRPDRDRRYDDRPPRRFDDDRPPRRFDDDRPPRRFGGDDRPPRRFGDDDRPPRRFGGDDRPPRRFDDRPPPRRFENEPQFDSHSEQPSHY